MEAAGVSGLSAAELGELQHEVRNALTAASGYTDYLLRRLVDRIDERERRALLTIKWSIQRANGLLEAAVGPRAASRCDLPALLREAVGQLPPGRSDDARLDLPGDSRLVGRWDRERVAQILANLLSNAAKYSPAGTAIEIRLSQVGGFARVTVKDAGIGIAPEHLETIFNGHRTALARQTAPGSGLGLRVSRRLAEAERGRLWAAGIPGQGSTFYLDLPLPAADGLDAR
jgi:signal transduction histidine kinase